MATLDITHTFLYRWRYYLGYGIIAIALIAALVFAGLYVPGGISEAEKTAVINSESVSISHLTANTVINLPFYLLQKASFVLFGVHTFTIKLPSLILGFFSAVGLLLLLRKWFAKNIAILGTLIAITTGQFLFVTQNGTISVLYLFWSVWILFLATQIAHRRRPGLIYKVLFFLVVALSLYTPLSIYALVAIGTAIILHPHLRFIIHQLSKKKLLLGILVALLVMLPLLRAIIATPSLLLTLLGIPTVLPDLGANALQAGTQFFGFIAPSGSTLMTPVFGLGSVLLIGMGIYHTIKTRQTAQSYIIAVWSILLIPIVLLRPTYTTITFLPLVLLLTTGLGSLLTYWYRLFPLNPYARVGGLIPIVVLVVALVVSGVDRYTYGYYYDPSIASSFSHDLSLIPAKTTLLVVAKDELAFYSVVDKYDPTLEVALAPRGDSFVATRAAHEQNPAFSDYQLSRIITSPASSHADRFYLYKN